MKKELSVLIGLLFIMNCSAYEDYITYDCKYLAKGGNTDMTIADVNNDGQKEIIAGFYNDGFGYLLDKNMKELWNIQTIVGVEATHSVDIEKDGQIEVVFGGGRTIYILDGEGNLSFKYITQNIIRHIDSGDLDNDGFVDLIFAAQEIRTSEVIVLNKESKIIWQKKVGGTNVPDFMIGDYDKDGSSDVVIAAGKSVAMYDNQGVTIWSHKVDGEATDLEVADINNDGSEDFIVSATAGLYAINNKGELIWETKEGGKIQAIKASDLDHDGKKEIAVAGFEKVLLLDNEGNTLWQRNATRQTNDIETGDLDMDGNEEIIAGSDIINVFDTQGNVQWEYKPYMRVQQIRVDDLDGDGKNELLVGALDNSLYLFKPRRVYLNEQKSYLLCEEARTLISEGDYQQALKCIDEAIDISKTYNTGECKEKPEDCTALQKLIQEKIQPSTTTTQATTTTAVTETTQPETTTTIQESAGGDNTLLFGAAVLVVIIIAAVILMRGKK